MRQIANPLQWMEPVLELAQQAGVVIMRIYNEAGRSGELAVEHKADDSPLTQADLQAHHCIAAGLAKLTPDIPVVSEEDAHSLAYMNAQGDFWLIDPLDGTKEFVARNGEFTVNIALVRGGVPILGVVVAPALNLAYWGGAGMGAFRAVQGVREPIRVAGVPEGTVRVVASKSHLNAETEAFIALLGAHELIQAGSSLKFCRVAEGAADVYPRLAPTCEWDTAAAQAVVEAAGGQVVQLNGEALHYGKGEKLNPQFVATAVPLAQLLALRRAGSSI